MSEPLRIAKIDNDKRQVFGWANVSVRKNGDVICDTQNHIMPVEELESAAYEFALTSRVGGEEHERGVVSSRMIESCVFTKSKMKAMGIPEGSIPEGWWIGFQVDDPQAWRMVKSGEYAMFSIEGQAVAEPIA